jgi:hypothetical protein
LKSEFKPPVAAASEQKVLFVSITPIIARCQETERPQRLRCLSFEKSRNMPGTNRHSVAGKGPSPNNYFVLHVPLFLTSFSAPVDLELTSTLHC